MDLLLRLMLVLIYLIWLPIALLARLFGADPLQLRKPDAATYWLVRDKATSRESYFSQASEAEGRPAHRTAAESGRRIGTTAPLLSKLLRALAPFCYRAGDIPKDASGE